MLPDIDGCVTWLGVDVVCTRDALRVHKRLLNSQSAERRLELHSDKNTKQCRSTFPGLVFPCCVS
jgi:hypothetical protein